MDEEEKKLGPSTTEHKMVQPIQKTIWQFLKPLKTLASYDLAIQVLDKKPR